MSIQKFATVLAALLGAAPAFAQVAVSADIGTTGAGAHLVVPMETYLNGRFGLNTFSRDIDETSGALDFKLKATLRSVDVLFDWYLSSGSNFHLTGGVVHNRSKIAGQAKPGADGKFTINGNSYAAATAGILVGEVKFRGAAPYLGVGWGNPLKSTGKWSFNSDVGAYFQGNPKAALANHGCTAATSVCVRIARDVNAVRDQFGEDASSFKVYPVLRVALGYRF